MEDAALSEHLAGLPPQQWTEARRRAEVIWQYLRLPDPSVADVDRYAERLGIRRRNFYVLVRIFREARAKRPGSRAQGRRQGHIAPEAAGCVADAIAAVGADAGPGIVYDEMARLCRERGVNPPSMSAVRTRLGRRPGRPNLSRRLGASADLMVDASELDLDVTVPGEAARPAHLLAALLPSAEVRAHRVIAGKPGALDAAALLLDVAGQRSAGAPAREGVLAVLPSTAMSLAMHGLPGALAAAGLAIDPAIPPLKDGAALAAAFGARIGRVGLLPRGRRRAEAAGEVGLDDARLVMAALVREHNAKLAADQAEPGPGDASPGGTPAFD